MTRLLSPNKHICRQAYVLKLIFDCHVTRGWVYFWILLPDGCKDKSSEGQIILKMLKM